MPVWTEKPSTRAGALELVVDAIDVERTEKSEMERFRDALSAPAVEKSIELTDQRGRKYSSGDALVMVKGIVALFGTLVFAFLLHGLAEMVFGAGFDGLTFMIVFAAAFLATAGFLVYRGRSSRRRTTVPKVRDHFTVTLDDGGLVLAGTDTRRTYDLETIDRFEGAKRLALVLKDGKRTELPLALPSPADNAALAARLGDALVEARAAGGYRGRGPRVGVAEEAPERQATADDGPHDDEAVRRSSER